MRRCELETRTGKTGFEFEPYVALRSQRATCLCQIFWSGNWALRVAPSGDGAMVSGGLNNWSFRHRMGVDRHLRLPTVLFGRFDGDLNAATRRLHDWRRAHRPDPDRPIPVQFNSWYAYAGEPTADDMLAIVPAAHRLGCEAFVVDAGWYRTDEGESAQRLEGAHRRLAHEPHALPPRPARDQRGVPRARSALRPVVRARGDRPAVRHPRQSSGVAAPHRWQAARARPARAC